MSDLIGRISEQEVLLKALKSNRSELVAVYGRRRVGKTFLIDQVYEKHIVFAFSGLLKANLAGQLQNFHLKISKRKSGFPKPKNWLEAFDQLEQLVSRMRSKKKKVIFIDEFPWLDGRKSNFLPAFDNFWNSYASKRKDMVVVICGSAASYMIKNIVRSTGGLHNRITEKIQLKPFNLHETELLLKKNRVNLARYDILQLYMCMGGIPHYLERILPGETVVTIIDRLCFAKDGFLRTEFDTIFFSLFQHADNHISIVKTLSVVKKGITRTEIIAKGRLKSGGTVTKTLEELEQSGFIESYLHYAGSKDALYRLSDEYSMFFLKFIKDQRPSSGGVWRNMYNQNSYKIWSGFSFETVCLKHLDQIKRKLGITGIHTVSSSWTHKNNPPAGRAGKQGAQIDLLIDRADNAINICEIKFYNTEFVITKSYADNLRNKVNLLKSATKTKKNIFVSMLTTYGTKKNKYFLQHIQDELTMNDLFLQA